MTSKQNGARNGYGCGAVFEIVQLGICKNLALATTKEYKGCIELGFEKEEKQDGQEVQKKAGSCRSNSVDRG